MRLYVAILLIFTTTCSFASNTYTEVTATTKYVYHYGNGRVLVTGFGFPNASCNNNGGFWIEHDHPHLNALLATIHSAHARGAKLMVRAKVNDCWYPEIDQTTQSRITIIE